MGVSLIEDHDLQQDPPVGFTLPDSRPQLHVSLLQGSDGNTLTWTNMPSAATILASYLSASARVDLTRYREVRLHVGYHTAGATGAVLALRYATSWTPAGSYVAICASELSVSISAAGSAFVSSSWTPLVDAAKGDVFIAPFGINGDGVADPVFALVQAEFR